MPARMLAPLAVLLASLTASLQAAETSETLARLKTANRDFCIKMGTRPVDAPKDEALLAPYCECVTETYWNSVPAASVQELLTKQQSADIRDNVKPRMAAAQAACRQKLKF